VNPSDGERVRYVPRGSINNTDHAVGTGLKMENIGHIVIRFGAVIAVAVKADGLIGWDAFDAVLTPGEIILLLSWKDHGAAEAFDSKIRLPEEARLRRVRVVRDYSMFDRREAPQYYPEVKRPSS
jgi:hypothetical protein